MWAFFNSPFFQFLFVSLNALPRVCILMISYIEFEVDPMKIENFIRETIILLLPNLSYLLKLLLDSIKIFITMKLFCSDWSSDDFQYYFRIGYKKQHKQRRLTVHSPATTTTPPLRRRRPPSRGWACTTTAHSSTYFFRQITSSIYSWSIGHILEHEFFCLGHLGCAGSKGKKWIWVILSNFWGWFFFEKVWKS